MEIEAAVVRERGGPFELETLELAGPRADEVLVTFYDFADVGAAVADLESGEAIKPILRF